MMPTDDAKKISRLNALGFNGLVIAWEAWKEKDRIKGDRDEPAKNPPMLKLVFFLWNVRIPIFGIHENLPPLDVDECLYSVL